MTRAMAPASLRASVASLRGEDAFQRWPFGSETPRKRTYALLVAHWRDYRWTALVRGDKTGRSACVEWHNHVGEWCTRGCGRSWPTTSVAETIELVGEWRAAVVSYLSYVNGQPELVDTIVAPEGDLGDRPGLLDPCVLTDPRYSLSAWVRTRRPVHARGGTPGTPPAVRSSPSPLIAALLRWKARWS